MKRNNKFTGNLDGASVRVAVVSEWLLSRLQFPRNLITNVQTIRRVHRSLICSVHEIE